MVKSVLGVAHQGFRDWVWQRVSAVFMTIYTVGLFIFLARHPDLSYADWQGFFAQGWVKVATILFFLSLLLHAWVGMWTIFTDYVTCAIGRFILHTMVLFALVSFFFTALFILWGV